MYRLYRICSFLRWSKKTMVIIVSSGFLQIVSLAFFVLTFSSLLRTVRHGVAAQYHEDPIQKECEGWGTLVSFGKRIWTLMKEYVTLHGFRCCSDVDPYAVCWLCIGVTRSTLICMTASRSLHMFSTIALLDKWPPVRARIARCLSAGQTTCLSLDGVCGGRNAIWICQFRVL